VAKFYPKVEKMESWIKKDIVQRGSIEVSIAIMTFYFRGKDQLFEKLPLHIDRKKR
jgi:hypothetical protein